MASILGNALTGLRAHQSALSTTSHNIANVNTEGYSRQRVEFATNPPQEFTTGFFGNGVNINGVTRIASDFLTSQLRLDTISFNELDTIVENASRLDNLLSNSRTNLSTGLDQFFNAMQVAADDPSSLPARQIVLSQARSLTERFNSVDARLGDMNSTVNSELEANVASLNGLLQGIADLNVEIGKSINSLPGKQPNDLLDKREELLRQVGELIGINVVESSGGSLNVFLNNGHSLVTGALVSEVRIEESTSDPNQKSFVLSVGDRDLDLTNEVTGGKIGGLLAFRRDYIDSGFSELGRVAVAFVDAFNDIHQSGMDLDGDVGNIFFTDVNERSVALGRVTADRDNVSATSTVTLLEIDDVSALVASAYEMRVGTSQGPNVIEVRRLSDNSVVALDVLSSAQPQVIEFDGLRLVMESGLYLQGDLFKLTPFRDFPGQVSLLVENPNDLALAQPVRGDARATNSGTGVLSLGDTIDTQRSQFTTLRLGALSNFDVGDTVSFDVTASDALDSFSVSYIVTGVPSIVEELATQMQAGLTARDIDDQYLLQVNAGAGTIDVVYQGSTEQASALRFENFADDLAGGAGTPAAFSASSTFGTVLNGTSMTANVVQSISAVAPYTFATPGTMSPPVVVRFTSPTTYDILDATDPGNLVDLVPPQRNIDYVPGRPQELFPSDTEQTYLNADGALVARAQLGGVNGYGVDAYTIVTTDPITEVQTTRTVSIGANESADLIADKLNGVPGIQASAGAEATLTTLNIADTNVTELVINGVPLPGVSTLASAAQAISANDALRGAGIIAELNQAGTSLTLRSVTGTDINVSMTGAAVGDSVTVTGLNAAGANPPSAVVDAANPLATVGGSLTVYLDDRTTLSATGAASGLFSAQPIAVSSFTGYTFTLTGAPDAGDEFAIGFNQNGISDNRNALKFGQLQTTKITDGGTTTFDEAYSRLVERVATQTSEADIGRDAVEALLRQSEAQREALSGVNLDEEAADVIRFQQAYNASAQLITVARNIFDSLLAAVQ